VKDCSLFRQQLAEWIADGRRTAEGGANARHDRLREHLAVCGDCRGLLATEDALDELLALDGAADAAPPAPPPPGLAGRVLEALETEREAARAERGLDLLLDGLPAPVAPVGLGASVIEGLAAERASVVLRPSPMQRGRSPRALRTVLALAAALLALLAWRPWTRGPAPFSLEGGVEGGVEGAVEVVARGVADEEVDDELLASLDVLENWELLTSPELELLLADVDLVESELWSLDASAEEGAEEDEG